MTSYDGRNGTTRSHFGRVHVVEKDDCEHRIVLYQFDNFYVEVFYHKEYNVVRRYTPFASTNLLNHT